MKILIAIGLLVVSAFAMAHDNDDLKGQCFIVNGNNKSKPCVVSSGGGAGGMYTILRFNNKNYHIEESTMCDSDCGAWLGSDIEHMKEAKQYYLDAKTKKPIKDPNYRSWFCYKQLSGNLNVCYMIN